MPDVQQLPPRRPTLLTVLAVLSLVYLSINVIGLVFSVASGPMSPEQLDNYYQQNSQMIADLRKLDAGDFADLIEKVTRFVEYENDKFWLMFAADTVIAATGITAVFMMLRRRKLGFHLYIVYSLLFVGVVFLAVPFAEVPLAVTLGNAFFGALFILLYSLNLKWMIR